MKCGPDTDVVFEMPQYYFDIVTYSPGNKPDPEKDRIISIQYQKIDFRSGKPIQEIEILREWNTSEEAIVTQFYNKFFRGGQNKWIFIPVGYDLNTAWEIITRKFEQYLGADFKNKNFHYTIPHIDLASVVVLLNGGNFIGARLEKVTNLPDWKRNIKNWYPAGDFGSIEEHIKKSANSFLQFYQKAKKNMPVILEERRPALAAGPATESKPTPPPPPEPVPIEKAGPEPLDVSEEEVHEVHSDEAEEVHAGEVEEVHEEEVHAEEVHEIHAEEVEEHELAAAEFAPEAVEMESTDDDGIEAHEVVGEDDPSLEVVEVDEEDGEVVEVDEENGEVVEVDEENGEVVEVDDHEEGEVISEVEEALSAKELKKRQKEEAKKRKLEDKLRKKQQKIK